MILTCPACKTRFEIDVAHLGAKARLVRCGQCGHKWRQNPEMPAAKQGSRLRGKAFMAGRRGAASRQQASRSGALDRSGGPAGDGPSAPWPETSAALPKETPWQGAAPRDAAASPANWAGWALLLAFLAGLGGVAYFGRDMLVAKIPPISRLYALAGLSVSLPKDHLSLENVTSVRRLISGDRVLIIEGEVLNASDSVVTLPPLRARLEDEQGNEISSWTFSAEDTELGPGESARFETSTRNPPDAGKNLTIALPARY